MGAHATQARFRMSAILLDVDDTLVDTKAAFRHAIVATASEYLPASTDMEEATTAWRRDRGGYYRAYTRGEMDHFTQRKLRVHDLHAQFGGPTLTDAEYVEWEKIFEAAFQEGWEAHPDAEPFLDALDARGIAYGALSNAQASYQEHKLAAVGLGRVPMLVGVDTFGVGKPDPRVFLEACRRLGSEPAQTYYVGDEFDIDARAAVEAGLRGVWCERAGTWASRDPAEVQRAGVVHVATLSELLPLLPG